MAEVTVLDGGMGQELARRGVPSPAGLWSAAALDTHPEEVMAAHRDFLRAGADVITTNTYATTRWRLADHGLAEQAAQLTRRGAELAAAARDDQAPDARVAGSLPPLTPTYRADLVPELQVLLDAYHEHAAVLAPVVDLILAETLTTVREAVAAVRVARDLDRPVWLSWTVDDDDGTRLRDGTPLADAVAAVRAADATPDAWLLNCSTPAAVTAGSQAVRGAVAADERSGVYPNGFAPIPRGWTVPTDGIPPSEEVTPERLAAAAGEWLGGGATIIGGCCETGPAHIAGLRDVVDGAGDPPK